MPDGNSVVDNLQTVRKTPKLTLHSIALQTASFEQSYKFYTEILGLRVVREPFQFKTRKLAWLDAGSALIELYSMRHGETSVPYSDNRLGPDHIAFVVGDLDAMIYHLIENGVKIIKGPYVPPSGDPRQPRVLFAEGPDGEELQFRETATA